MAVIGGSGPAVGAAAELGFEPARWSWPDDTIAFAVLADRCPHLYTVGFAGTIRLTARQIAD